MEKIKISVDSFSYNTEIVKLNNIASFYSNMEKELPKFLKRPFKEYVLFSDFYFQDLKEYAETSITMPVPISKKLELLDIDYNSYRDKLDSLKRQMTEALLLHEDIDNGQISLKAKKQLLERYTLYCEGESNLAVYKIAKKVEESLNELNDIMSKYNKTKFYQFSQFNQSYFVRSGDTIELNYGAILF